MYTSYGHLLHIELKLNQFGFSHNYLKDVVLIA